MHLPKTPVDSGIFSALRRNSSIWVNFRQRKMPEYKSELLSEMSLHGFDDGVSRRAMWALIITILYESDGSILVTEDMIAG
jgi:hypothetical protein